MRFTEEHKRRISEALKGKPKSEEAKQNMRGTKGRTNLHCKGKNRPEISGERHPKWKGGITIRQGRAFLRIGSKYRLRSRVVMEGLIRRPLLLTEIVHHKNGKTLDDRPENLEIVSRARHNQMHIRNLTGK